jgi:hypothetical protein
VDGVWCVYVECTHAIDRSAFCVDRKAIGDDDDTKLNQQ